MKHTNWISFAAGAAVCATLGLSLGFAQPEKVKDKAKDKAKEKIAERAPERAGGQPDMDAMMAEMMEKGTPGEHHKALGKTLGHWTVAAEFVQPGEEPMTGTGTMDTRWALGGRFTVSEFKMPDFMGAPFEGMAIMGYDKYKGEYTGVWIDTMSTHVTTTRGSMSEDGTLVMHGTSVTPMGETPMKIESSISENKLVDKFYDGLPDGSWVHSGTITYTRGQSDKKGG